MFFRGDMSLGPFIWGELARLRGLAWLGEVIFIPLSYVIFYITAKSLLRHCFDHVAFKQEIFYFQYTFQKAATVSFYCIQYCE